jgi:O-antigen ligase
LFLALALSAKGSAVASPALWLTALVALAAAFFLHPPSGRQSVVTPLAGAVIFLAVWITVTNKWLSSSYTAAATYHAAFLLGGFLIGRRACAENAGRLYGTALAFVICLAGWAIWQRIHGLDRAHALFETPATLAATINLVLLPGLVLAAWGKRRLLLVAAMAVLVAALGAATSRGGWLALTIAGLIALAVGRRLGFRLDRATIIVLAVSLGAGWALSLLATLAGDWMAASSIAAHPPEYSMLGENAAKSSIDRLGMYELALRSLQPSSLFAGIGYLGFYYVMEAGGNAIPGIEPGTTYFVHNDYLQTLLELGIPGLAALLAVIVLPLIMAWRASPRIGPDRDKKLLLATAVGSLSSMGIHALMDFPFYIPICLLMYGAALGLLDTALGPPVSAETAQKEQGRPTAFRRAAGAGIATVAAWLLATPVAAQAVAAYAHHQWSVAQGERAAYWFEIARRLEPRDWRYHWYAGQFWFLQAAQSREPEAARLADQAFADGDAANPREMRNLAGRVETHLRLRPILLAPADGATLLGWAELAGRLAPNDVHIQTLRARVLKQLGAINAESAK